jgi:phage host-nuclease inhibitor protein Gam
MSILKPRAAAKPTQPTASPPPSAPQPKIDERQALATAIATRNHIQRELDATTKALSELQAKRHTGAATKAVEAAKAGVETAKANAAAFLTANLQWTAGEPPLSVKDARAALQEAEDNLETQLAVEADLKAKKENEKTALDFAKSTVKAKIEAVVRADPSFRKLFAEFEEMRRLVAQRAQLFSFLFSMIPRELQGWQTIPLYRPEDLQDETPPWRAAIAELESNSDAPLPS